jgi:hypothetical protein
MKAIFPPTKNGVTQMDKKHGRRSLSLLAMMLLFKALFWMITPQAARQQDAWTPPVAACEGR